MEFEIPKIDNNDEKAEIKYESATPVFNGGSRLRRGTGPPPQRFQYNDLDTSSHLTNPTSTDYTSPSDKDNTDFTQKNVNLF